MICDLLTFSVTNKVLLPVQHGLLHYLDSSAKPQASTEIQDVLGHKHFQMLRKLLWCCLFREKCCHNLNEAHPESVGFFISS